MGFFVAREPYRHCLLAQCSFLSKLGVTELSKPSFALAGARL